MALDEQLLDNADGLAAADPSGSLRALASAGAQVRTALTATEEAQVARIVRDGRPRAVVVASLGGSAVVGDVLTMLAGSASPVPVSVRRGLPLPGWVGPLDLVVAVSMSGRAPGPVGLAAEAARRGARLLASGVRTGRRHWRVRASCTRSTGIPSSIRYANGQAEHCSSGAPSGPEPSRSVPPQEGHRRISRSQGSIVVTRPSWLMQPVAVA